VKRNVFHFHNFIKGFKQPLFFYPIQNSLAKNRDFFYLYNIMANWDKIESTGNVEDRRGSGGAIVGAGSLTTILILGFMLLTGGGSSADVQNVLDQLSNTSSVSSTEGEFVDTKKYKEFAQKIIGSNNDVWKAQLAKKGEKYVEPKLVLFRGNTQSGCGGASSQIGPHYCPTDQTVYLDETFFEELKTRFGAKGGDVAEAYVMAHEIGHHVQKVRGTFAKVDTSVAANSVKVELQADCYAGIWAGEISQEGIISESEISQAIDAAEAVGDDRIQKSQTGSVSPETWTHGSSAQRKEWFLKGYKSKDANTCNTVN
jgi:uncharacterized protein